MESAEHHTDPPLPAGDGEENAQEPRFDAEHAEDVRSNDELASAAAHGLRWIAYARIAIELTLFGSMVILARLISPVDFGIFAIVVILQELALSIPSEGIGSALVQKKTITREHMRGGLLLCLAVGVILLVVTLVLAYFVFDPIFGSKTAWLAAATAPFYLLGAIYAAPTAVLRRALDFRRLSMIELLSSTVRAFATLALAIIGLNASALVFGSLASLAAAVVLALIFAPVPWPRWRPKEMRELLTFGGPASLASVAWAGFRNGDYAVIGATLGPALAGIYWRAYQLAVEYQRKITIAMAQIAFPVLARTAGVEEMLALRQRMVQLLAVVLFPLLAVLFLVAPTLVPWMYGSQWDAAVTPTQILVIGGASTLMIDACGSALMAVGRARTILGFGVAHFVFYVGTVLAVVHLGLTAVAIGGAVIHTLFLVVAYWLLLQGLVPNPIKVLWQDAAPALIGCVALVAVALPVNLLLESAHWAAVPHMFTVAASGGVAYLIVLRLLFPACSRDLHGVLRKLVPDRILNAFRRRPRLPMIGGPAPADKV
jgi:O-antigen/teichoic acid export membrane protein